MNKLTAIAVLIFISTTFAQVNIEKYNNLNTSVKSIKKVTFNFSAKTGNTDIQELGIDARLNYKGENYYSIIVGQGSYGWKNGTQYSNNALLHFRYLHELHKFYYPEFFSQINYDKSRLLQLRTLVGAGLRFSIISDSISNLNYGASYMFEYEKLDLPKYSEHLNKTNDHRWNNYLSYSNIISSNSRVSFAVYYQPRFDKFNDFRILSENYIGVEISETLVLSLSFNLRYDSLPPDKIKNLDTVTITGITVNL